jgi:hypothetical protein
LTEVPEGTTVTTWTRTGNTISDDLGQLIERGDYQAIAADPRLASEATFARSHLPGSKLPDFTLGPPEGLNVMSASRTVAQPTKLSQLLTQDMGHIDWAACQWVRPR